MTIRAIMSYESTNFLDVAKNGTPNYALMNKGIESATVAYNPTTQERHFIADKNATSETTGFAKTLDVTQFAYEGDDTFEFIDEIFFNDTLNAKSNLLQVYTYRENGDGTYDAKLTPVTIRQDSENVEGGDQKSYAYNVVFAGDSVTGTVTITDGKPVFTADTEE